LDNRPIAKSAALNRVGLDNSPIAKSAALSRVNQLRTLQDTYLSYWVEVAIAGNLENSVSVIGVWLGRIGAN
jgi:hypothetical protein